MRENKLQEKLVKTNSHIEFFKYFVNVIKKKSYSLYVLFRRINVIFLNMFRKFLA